MSQARPHPKEGQGWVVPDASATSFTRDSVAASRNANWHDSKAAAPLVAPPHQRSAAEQLPVKLEDWRVELENAAVER